MENGLNIFRFAKTRGGGDTGPGGDERKWTFVEYDHPALGTVHIPLMAKFSSDGVMVDSSASSFKVVEIKDENGNIYLAAAGA